MLRGVIRERTPRLGFRLLANELAPLILTDGGLALSEPKAVGARGSTKVLAASSLGSCLVFVSGAVVTVALAAIGRDMGLSPLDLQWVMTAELLPLDSRARRSGRGADQPDQRFRSEPLGARHPDRRSGRLSRPHRDATAIRRQRHAAPVPLRLAVGGRREPVHRAPLRAVHGHANLDP